METGRSRLSWNMTKPKSPLQTVILVCLVLLVSYFAPKLAGALLLHPKTAWPLWPGCAVLVSVLLFVPRRIWPVVIAAAFAGFILYDLQAGVPISSIAWFIPADTVQVLIAALGLSYSFDRAPRLNSVRALSKYSFFAVFLGPFAAAFLSAFGIPGDYWTSWVICFVSEVLAFVTLTPAILSWVSNGPVWVRKSRAYHLEFAALIVGLVLLGYITFTTSENSSSPALLYSLVPFLLWSALRFGSLGVSTSVVVVTFLSIWGVIHGRGPFTGVGPFSSVLSLQLFLVFAAAPSMVLAVLVEERKRIEEALRKSEERFRLAAHAGRMYAYEWDVATDIVVRSEEHMNVIGFNSLAKPLTRQQLVARVHPDDRALFIGSVDQFSPEHPTIRMRYRVLRPDGSVVWLEKNAQAFFDEDGRMLNVIGMVTDITDHKQAEDALRESEDKLRVLLDSAAEAIYGVDLEGRCTFCNPACLRALAYERVDELIGKNMHELIHHTRADGTLLPVEECRIFRAFRTGEGVHVEDEVLWRANGTSFPAEYWSHPQRRGGEVVGAVIAFVDITDRKLTEAALAGLGRRLIEAQEQERARIARELHDDLSQRMALLQISLEQVAQDTVGLPFKTQQQLHNITKISTEVSSNLHDLSHQLHPYKLDTLGLVAALGSFCNEFSRQHNLLVQFVYHDVPEKIPKDVTLCLFRIVQEALRNVVKHSGGTEAEVELSAHDDRIDLCISDSGTGFSPAHVQAETGLGLISMRERLRLVEGHLSIESEPSRGTRIRVRIPLFRTKARIVGEEKVHQAGA